MPLPVLLLIDKDIRRDAPKIGFLYLESMAITGLLYTGATYFHDKYRPYAYNSTTPMGKRTSGGAKNSFFAGHVALVGTSVFFTAKVYADYHPNSSLRHVLYGAATAATLATGYLRYKGGDHFTTDIIIGTGVGVLSGLLVPKFHKVKDPNGQGLSFSPWMGGRQAGVAAVYRF
jgi:membrane-associated phospholipid phosphatase